MNPVPLQPLLKTLFVLPLTLLIVLFSSLPVKAAGSASYYDWGPYYNQPQVLGFTFSSLEQLPPIEIPQDISLPTATGILPGNPLHFFETIAENAQLTFTFNPIQKEELRLSFASERLSEAKTLIDQGNYQAAQTATTSYQKPNKTPL